MIPDWAKGFLPDGLQSTKQLASYGANFFWLLFGLQFIGFDFSSIPWVKIAGPAVSQWATFAVAFFFSIVQYALGGVQDKKLQEKIGNGTGNGHGHGSNPPTKPPGV